MSADHMVICKDMYLPLCLWVTWQNERSVFCYDLPECIDSINNQTCPPFNAFVVQPARGFAFIESPQNEGYTLFTVSGLITI